MSANLSSLALNPSKVLHAAVHEVSPIAQPGSAVGILFPDGGPNVLNTPGAKSVSLTTISNRGINRAGDDVPIAGLARGADRAVLEMFASTPITSTVKRFGAEVPILNEDILDLGNLDPQDEAAARAAMAALEMKAAQMLNASLTRYSETDFYRLLAGSALDFTAGTAFTSTAASAASPAMNPDDYNLASPLLDLPRFIQHMCRDLTIASAGQARPHSAGVTLLVTPECMLAWGANISLQGYSLQGTAGQGYTAVQGNFLPPEGVAAKVMDMSGGYIKGVVVLDSMRDTAAAGSAESIDFAMGSVVGLTAIVHAPANISTAGGRTTVHNTAILRHHYKSESPRWVENKNNTGMNLIADRFQAFKVVSSGYGVSYYDA